MLRRGDSWNRGDECIYKGNSAIVIGWHPSKHVVIIDSDEFGLKPCSPFELSKPETPEQKAEREMKEAIDEIKGTIDFFADSYMSALSLYEQGYRKQ